MLQKHIRADCPNRSYFWGNMVPVTLTWESGATWVSSTEVVVVEIHIYQTPLPCSPPSQVRGEMVPHPQLGKRTAGGTVSNSVWGQPVTQPETERARAGRTPSLKPLPQALRYIQTSPGHGFKTRALSHYTWKTPIRINFRRRAIPSTKL